MISPTGRHSYRPYMSAYISLTSSHGSDHVHIFWINRLTLLVRTAFSLGIRRQTSKLWPSPWSYLTLQLVLLIHLCFFLKAIFPPEYQLNYAFIYVSFEGWRVSRPCSFLQIMSVLSLVISYFAASITYLFMFFEAISQPEY